MVEVTQSHATTMLVNIAPGLVQLTLEPTLVQAVQCSESSSGSIRLDANSKAQTPDGQTPDVKERRLTFVYEDHYAVRPR